MTSAPETICGRCLRTESRTFSSCRNQSRAPRENRSYHFAAPTAGFSLLSAMVFGSYSCANSSFTLLLRHQRCHIAQCFFGTVLIVTILAHETLLDYGDLLPRILVRPRCRGHQPEYIAALFEEILLDGLAHARVACELELLPGLESHHGLA